MKKEEKAERIEQIKGLVKNSSAMFLVDYRGVNVADINKLRSNFRKDGINYKVLKNTLFKKALEQAGGFEKFNSQLVGMTGVAFAGDNFVAPAKIIKKYFDESKDYFIVEPGNYELQIGASSDDIRLKSKITVSD